jgi:hypothetical protein
MASSSANNAESQDEMKRMYLTSIRQAAENIPTRTKISYGSKQKEFKDFCLEENYDDGCTVYAEKLNHFLRKKVIKIIALYLKACF